MSMTICVKFYQDKFDTHTYQKKFDTHLVVWGRGGSQQGERLPPFVSPIGPCGPPPNQKIRIQYHNYHQLLQI